MTYWPFPHSSPQQPIWNFQDLKFQIPSPPSVGTFQDLEEEEMKMNKSREKMKSSEEEFICRHLWCQNPGRLVPWSTWYFADWTWNCIVCLVRESPSSCPLVFASSFRWSGFHSELGTVFFLGEVVKVVQGQGGRESFGQLHSAFVAAAAGTLVKIKLESQLWNRWSS